MFPRFQDYPRHIDHLIQAALAAADPATAVRRNLRREGRKVTVGSYTHDLSKGRIFVVGVGKASISMGIAAAEILGDTLVEGVLITKSEGLDSPAELRSHLDLADNIRVHWAGHPISDERSVAATADAIKLAKQAESTDLVLCLISGGASALFTYPRLPLLDWQELIDSLLASGCTINELNAVRKQLDQVKGGGLSRIASPAQCASLILSDVVGNRLDVIGSGPTVPNPDDPATARRVLLRYNIEAKLRPDVWLRIEDQLRLVQSIESFNQVPSHNFIIGDVRQAEEAAVAAAKDLGFDARLLTAHLEGEAREVGRVVAALAMDAPCGTCLVLGGETTVTLRGDGLGGRNQELALSAALALDGWKGLVLASFASDGDDGPTDAAGASVTGTTVREALAKELDPLDYLDRNDSYRFFQQVGGLIITGQTGTNVNDLIFVLKYKELTNNVDSSRSTY